MVVKVCNGDHSFDISAEAAEKLKAVIQDAPNFLYRYPRDRSAGLAHASTQRTVAQGTGSSSGTGMLIDGALTQPSSQHSQVSRPGMNLSADPTPLGVVSEPKQSISSHYGIAPQSRHVFLGVKCGDDYPIAHLQVDAMTDTEFFRSLRREYFRLRRWWRYCFYWWRYSHCEFYRVGYRILCQGQCR